LQKDAVLGKKDLAIEGDGRNLQNARGVKMNRVGSK